MWLKAIACSITLQCLPTTEIELKWVKVIGSLIFEVIKFILSRSNVISNLTYHYFMFNQGNLEDVNKGING